MTSREPSQGYRLKITGPAARTLAERLLEKVAAAVHEFIVTTLADNPRRLGKQLLIPPYAGTWAARRGAYRVLFEIDEDSKTVTVTSVEHRGDAYRSR